MTDLTGHRFGRLTVLHRAESLSQGRTIRWGQRRDAARPDPPGSASQSGGKRRQAATLQRGTATGPSRP